MSNALEILELKTKSALYKAYMPFLENGGLFLATQKSFQIDAPMTLEVHLPEEIDTEVHNATGTVAWIAPTSSQGRWTPGVGIAFDRNEPNRRLGEKIQLAIADHPSEAPTNTL